MKTFTWAYLFAGVVIAIIAGLAIEWINRVILSPTCDANTVAWRRLVTSRPGLYVYGSGAAPQDAAFNENAGGSFYGPSCSDNRPAWIYAGGAPTSTYRPYTRVGAVESCSQ